MNKESVKPRARDLGLPFDGVTGKFNAITDVAANERVKIESVIDTAKVYALFLARWCGLVEK